MSFGIVPIIVRDSATQGKVSTISIDFCSMLEINDLRLTGGVRSFFLSSRCGEAVMDNLKYESHFLGQENWQWLYHFSLVSSIPWWSWVGQDYANYVFLYSFIQQTQCLISSSKGQQGILLLAFFEAKIRQFHVTQHLSSEDVLGEAILRGVNFIQRQSEPIHSPVAWLRRTGYNIVREVHRRHKSERSLDSHPMELKAPAADPVEFDERLPKLQRALTKLPEADRQVLVWHYVERCSWREVAARVDSTEMAVRQRGCRARSRLLRAMED